jgi:tyrosyl-tRNA synthetase
MALPDEAIIPGFKLATTLSLKEIGRLEKDAKQNPMNAKKRLAFEITQLCHGKTKANQSQTHFEQTFQKQRPQFKKTLANQKTLVATVAQVVGSNSKAKRLIADGAVDVNSKTIKDFDCQTKVGDKLKIGKKTFVTLK